MGLPASSPRPRPIASRRSSRRRARPPAILRSTTNTLKKAPGVTRERMYLETMEHVLGPMDKTIVDLNSASPPVPYIALEPLQPKTAGSGK